MDLESTRGWGIGLSAAMIAGALMLALTAREPPPRSTPAAPTTVVSPPSAAPSILIVHFRGNGPLARAEHARSAHRIRAELRRQRAFRGLCFERFEAHGLVLRSCTSEALGAWPGRLRAMRAVASVEPGE